MLELIESGQLQRGTRSAILIVKDHDTGATSPRSARDEGWSVRETERPAGEEAGAPRPERSPIVVHPDLAEALAAAEDALRTSDSGSIAGFRCCARWAMRSSAPTYRSSSAGAHAVR